MDIIKDLYKKYGDYEKEYEQFDEWLDDVYEKNDDYFEAIKKITPIFFNFSKKSKHPKTIFILYGFITHLSTIKNALIDLSKENNIYSMKALYRIYLEHWIKGTYIWVRYTKEKNDEVGKEYQSLGRIKDDLLYGNSLNQINKILNAEENNKDPWDVLSKINPDLQKVNKKEFNEKSKKFEYKRMIKYLVDNKAPGNDWALTIIPEYSKLSSFIHGGPRASDQYGSKTIGNEQFQEYKGMIRFSFNMTMAYAYSVFMLMLIDATKQEKEKILPLLFKFSDKSKVVE